MEYTFKIKAHFINNTETVTADNLGEALKKLGEDMERAYLVNKLQNTHRENINIEILNIE